MEDQNVFKLFDKYKCYMLLDYLENRKNIGTGNLIYFGFSKNFSIYHYCCILNLSMKYYLNKTKCSNLLSLQLNVLSM